MLVDIQCKTGKLQVSEDGFVRVVAPFNRIVWQVPCGAITRITAKDGFALSSDITFHTGQGQYQAEMVSKMKTSNVYALFPHLEVGATQQSQQAAPQVPSALKVAGAIMFPDAAIASKLVNMGHKKWYHDQKLRTYIVAYEHDKEMQKEVGEAGKNGWIPQSTIGTGGQLNRSFLFGLKNSKQKITITFVRTPEWLAQNG